MLSSVWFFPHLESCPWFRSPQPQHNRRRLQLVWKGQEASPQGLHAALSLKLLLGFFFFFLRILTLLGGSKTRGMSSEIWLWFFFSQSEKGRILELGPFVLKTNSESREVCCVFIFLSIVHNIWHRNAVLTLWEVYFCFLRSLSRLNHNILQGVLKG